MEIDFSLNNNDIDNFLKSHFIDKDTKFIVDRFEENFAICENKNSGEILDIPTIFISEDVKEGNIIKLENNIYVVDKETYSSEIEEIKNLASLVFKRKNKE